MALAAVLWSGKRQVRLLDGVGMAPAVYLFALAVAVAYIGGYLLHMFSLRGAPASTVAPIFNIEPIVATTAAAITAGKRLPPDPCAAATWFSPRSSPPTVSCGGRAESVIHTHPQPVTGIELDVNIKRTYTQPELI